MNSATAKDPSTLNKLLGKLNKLLGTAIDIFFQCVSESTKFMFRVLFCLALPPFLRFMQQWALMMKQNFLIKDVAVPLIIALGESMKVGMTLLLKPLFDTFLIGSLLRFCASNAGYIPLLIPVLGFGADVLQDARNGNGKGFGLKVIISVVGVGLYSYSLCGAAFDFALSLLVPVGVALSVGEPFYRKKKAAAEKAAKEAAEKGAKEAAEKGAKEAAEKGAKEAAEKGAKEAAEKGAKEAAEKAKEAAEKAKENVLGPQGKEYTPSFSTQSKQATEGKSEENTPQPDPPITVPRGFQ